MAMLVSTYFHKLITQKLTDMYISKTIDGDKELVDFYLFILDECKNDFNLLPRISDIVINSSEKIKNIWNSLYNFTHVDSYILESASNKYCYLFEDNNNICIKSYIQDNLENEVKVYLCKVDDAQVKETQIKNTINHIGHIGDIGHIGHIGHIEYDVQIENQLDYNDENPTKKIKRE